MGVLQQGYIDIVGFLIPRSISSDTLKFYQHSQSTTLLKTQMLAFQNVWINQSFKIQ
jgi:hypothetical protein